MSKSVTFTDGVTSDSISWNIGTLIFNKVISNVGGGYNPHTGIFTAPVSGDYVFFVTIQSTSRSGVQVDIVLNGSSKVRAMASSYDTNDRWETGTNLVTLFLKQGDTVWIRHHHGTGYYTYSDAPTTTISGYLI
ncbi:cerebellin-3-like [Saccostrea cucullata]|uniref:cerebellin-3-like n=1 Tax=Saccostrea cuccullata TaxID=36930 RepID=UPI002ED2A622